MSKKVKPPLKTARRFSGAVLDKPILTFGYPSAIGDDDDDDGEEDLPSVSRNLPYVVSPFTSISSNLYKADYNNRIIVINERIDERCFVYAKMIEHWNREDKKAQDLKRRVIDLIERFPQAKILFHTVLFDTENGYNTKDAELIQQGNSLIEEHEEIKAIIYELQSANFPASKVLDYEPIPIKIKFNSQGGALLAYQTLADVIALSKTKVIGINMGMAYSAAGFLLVCCHERLALRKSHIMVHRGSGAIFGTYEQTENAQKNYKQEVDEMIKSFRERTKIPNKVLKEKMNPDWYLSAEQALRLGIIDKIVDDINDLI